MLWEVKNVGPWTDYISGPYIIMEAKGKNFAACFNAPLGTRIQLSLCTTLEGAKIVCESHAAKQKAQS